jgi:hypothetical protein
VIGRGARITYHSTVLAGSIVSDDALLATHALLRGDIPPHGIAMGLPARTTRVKLRAPGEFEGGIDARSHPHDAGRKANPLFPEPTPNQTRTPDAAVGSTPDSPRAVTADPSN